MKWVRASARKSCGRRGSGVAADQTNAMLATSKEVIFPSATPLRKKQATNGLSYCRGCLLATLGNLSQIAARCHNRVNRVDCWDILGIVTFGTAQFDEPLAVAPAHHTGNANFT